MGNSFNISSLKDKGDVEEVKKFIERNPTKLNEDFSFEEKRDKIGFEGTLLHFSCFWNKPKVVSYLLSQNADVTKKFDGIFIIDDSEIEGGKYKEYDGLTALEIAKRNGFNNIVNLFNEKDRQEKERAEKERTEKEIAERERVEKEIAERERVEKEIAERERAEKEIAERERVEKERAEKEGEEKERVEKERAEKEITDWFCCISLGSIERERYSKLFIELGFDDLTVISLMEEREIAVNFPSIPVGHQKKIWQQIQTLGKKGAPEYSSSFTGDLAPLVSENNMQRITTTGGEYLFCDLSLEHPIVMKTKEHLVNSNSNWCISSAQVILNSSQRRLFFGCIDICEKRKLQPAFKTNLEEESNEEFRKKIIDNILTSPYILQHNRDVPIARLYHGTTSDIAKSIILTGYASLATLDDGWFGRAVYMTENPLYALEFCQNKPNPCLMVTDTILFNPFPVISDDAPPPPCKSSEFRFYGKPPIKNFKSHVIPVVKYESLDYRPPKREDIIPIATEFAIFDENHLLPRVLLFLSPVQITIPVSPTNLSLVKPDANWSVEQVVQWMSKLSLGDDYSLMIRQNRIDGYVLLKMVEKDWKEVGMTTFGDRKKVVSLCCQV